MPDVWIILARCSRCGDCHDRVCILPASGQFELARPVLSGPVHELDADHAVCIPAPQQAVRALAWECWSAQPGHVQVAVPGRR